MDLVTLSGSILLIALAILGVRYGHIRYPYTGGSDLQPKMIFGVCKS
jgi:protein PsiE